MKNLLLVALALLAFAAVAAGAPQDWRRLDPIAIAGGWIGFYEWEHSSLQWNTPIAKVWVRARFLRRDSSPRFERSLYALNCINRTIDTLETTELGPEFGLFAKALPKPDRINIPPDTVFDDLRTDVCAERPPTLREFLDRIDVQPSRK